MRIGGVSVRDVSLWDWDICLLNTWEARLDDKLLPVRCSRCRPFFPYHSTHLHSRCMHFNLSVASVRENVNSKPEEDMAVRGVRRAYRRYVQAGGQAFS